MGFLKLLLNIGLILVSIVSYCIADTSEITFLPSNPKPLSYNISLIPHLEKGRNFTYYGKIDVTLEIISDTSNISLHSQELELNERKTLITNNFLCFYTPIKHSHNNVTNILTLNFNEVLFHGLYTLHMEFVGNIIEAGSEKNGFIKIPYIDRDKRRRKYVIVTFLKPNHAKRVFPCWDEPAIKTTFNISVKHHSKYKVLSNMGMREQTVISNGMVWTHFDTTHVMSIYQVGIVILGSNFVSVSNADQTVNFWCRSHMIPATSFLLDITERITSLLVQYTNISEKISKTDHVMVYNYPTMSQQYWGLIIYNESKVVNDGSTYSIFQRNDTALLVAHGLVHQWFGNLVTPSSWSYQWLSEGFAEFFATYFLDKVTYEERIMDLFVLKRLHHSLALDDGLMQPVTLELNNKIDYDMFGVQVRYKAPVLLRMVQHTITDEVFQRGIQKYFDKHQFGLTTSDDIWSAIQSALDESYTLLHNNYTIKEVMDTWTNQKRYPILNVTRNYGTGEVTITQKCCLGNNDINNNDTNNKWWIPITFATQSNPDFSRTVPDHWLGPDQTISFKINASDWIIVNVQQTAYCRVYYDTRNWYKIIRYLNSVDFQKIHVLNRAQLIDDAYAFWKENLLSKSVFLKLMRYLSRDREADYVAWYPMFRILRLLSPYYPLPEDERFELEQILQEGFTYVHERIPTRGTNELFQLEITKWSCMFDNFQCKADANYVLNQHLTDPNTYRVPRVWQDWTYCFGLAIANRTTWDKMFKLYQQTQDKKFLKYLSCSEKNNIIIHYLSILSEFSSRISTNPLFDDQTVSSIYKIIIKKHANNGPIFDYIFTPLHIKPRSITAAQLIKFYILNVSSNEQIDKLRRYSETHLLPNDLNEICNLIEKRKEHLKIIGDKFATK